MDCKAFEEYLKLNKIEYKTDEPMCCHTSFKIGGNADIFVNIHTAEELTAVFIKARELAIPTFVLGKGSNILVSDKGIEGAVISLCGMDSIKADNNLIFADAGASLTAVCNKALETELEGLEFAFGIPGSVGGALYMNAGAYGGEMSQVVKEAYFVDSEGKEAKISSDEMKLGYRKSVFTNSEKIITRVCFELKKGEKSEIKSKMDDFMCRRKSKQPLEYPSAGSTFKRPQGYFAGALIEKNNLKGARVGGAMVSEKHAGFVINYDNATCEDVKALMEKVKNTVLEADGVELQPEVIFIGRK